MMGGREENSQIFSQKQNFHRLRSRREARFQKQEVIEARRRSVSKFRRVRLPTREPCYFFFFLGSRSSL